MCGCSSGHCCAVKLHLPSSLGPWVGNNWRICFCVAATALPMQTWCLSSYSFVNTGFSEGARMLRETARWRNRKKMHYWHDDPQWATVRSHAGTDHAMGEEGALY